MIALCLTLFTSTHFIFCPILDEVYLVAAAQSPVDSVDNDGNGGDVTITRALSTTQSDSRAANDTSRKFPEESLLLVEITLTWHSLKTPCPFSECWKCHEILWTPLPSTPHYHCLLLPPSSSRTLTTLWSSKWIREEWLDYYDTWSEIFELIILQMPSGFPPVFNV